MMPLAYLVEYLDEHVSITCEHEHNVGEEPRRETFTGTMTEIRKGGVVVGGEFIPNKIIIHVEKT